jgi:uncharacterized protein (DUF1697 family)
MPFEHQTSRDGRVAMNIYIALFRGINVGGNNLLPMTELAGILERAGCTSVRTYIQSGNAVFSTRKRDPKKIADEIGAKILEVRGFRPKVMLLGLPELEQAIKNNPFKAAEGKALHFFFLESVPKKPDLAALTALEVESERFALEGTVFYLYTPEGFGRSKLAAKVERCLGVAGTARNWNTVARLMTMAKPV